MNEPTQLPGFREAFYRRERRSVPLVRQFARQALLDWAYGSRMDDVLLCVSELATNALVHGVPPGRGFRIQLYSAQGVLRIELHDSGDGEVLAASGPAPDAEGGRGLLLVGRSPTRGGWGSGIRARLSGASLPVRQACLSNRLQGRTIFRRWRCFA